MDTYIEPFDLWLARRAAAYKFRDRRVALRLARCASLSEEVIRELKRQVANYRAEWQLLRSEYKAVI